MYIYLYVFMYINIGRELIERVAGTLGNRGVAFDEGKKNMYALFQVLYVLTLVYIHPVISIHVRLYRGARCYLIIL